MINNPNKFLNLIEQEIAFLDDVLILRIPLVTLDCLDHIADFVYFRTESTRGDEVREFFVEELRRHPEDFRHGRQQDTLVGLEKLSERKNSKLAQNVNVVRAEETVEDQVRLQVQQLSVSINHLSMITQSQDTNTAHEVLVVAAIQRVHELLKFRSFDDDGNDVSVVDDLSSQSITCIRARHS